LENPLQSDATTLASSEMFLVGPKMPILRDFLDSLASPRHKDAARGTGLLPDPLVLRFGHP